MNNLKNIKTGSQNLFFVKTIFLSLGMPKTIRSTKNSPSNDLKIIFRKHWEFYDKIFMNLYIYVAEILNFFSFHDVIVNENIDENFKMQIFQVTMTMKNENNKQHFAKLRLKIREFKDSNFMVWSFRTFELMNFELSC